MATNIPSTHFYRHRKYYKDNSFINENAADKRVSYLRAHEAKAIKVVFTNPRGNFMYVVYARPNDYY